MYIAVSGSGTLNDPYVISSDGVDISDAVTFVDTSSVNFSVTGLGTDNNPWTVKADVTMTLDGLSNVVVPNPNPNEVLAYNDSTSRWVNAPAVTVGPGDIVTGTSVDGDGTVSTPLETALRMAEADYPDLSDNGTGTQYQLLGKGTDADPLTSTAYLGTNTKLPADDLSTYPVGVTRHHVYQTGIADGWPDNYGNLMTFRSTVNHGGQLFIPMDASRQAKAQVRFFDITHNPKWTRFHAIGGPVLPDAMSTGSIDLDPPAGGGTVSGTILFPVGRFQDPSIYGEVRAVTQAWSMYPDQHNTTQSGLNWQTGMTVYLYRQNSQNTSVQWMAAQGAEGGLI